MRLDEWVITRDLTMVSFVLDTSHVGLHWSDTYHRNILVEDAVILLARWSYTLAEDGSIRIAEDDTSDTTEAVDPNLCSSVRASREKVKSDCHVHALTDIFVVDWILV